MILISPFLYAETLGPFANASIFDLVLFNHPARLTTLAASNSAMSDSEDISLDELKGYRRFVFPEQFQDPSNGVYLGVDVYEDWMSRDGLEAYRRWEGRTVEEKASEAAETRIPGIKGLRAYHSFFITQNYRRHPSFSLESPETWFKSEAYRAMQLYQAENNIPNETSKSFQESRSRASSIASSVLDTPDLDSRPSSRMSIATGLSVPFSTRSRATSNASSAFDMESRASSRMATSSPDLIEGFSDEDSEDENLEALRLFSPLASEAITTNDSQGPQPNPPRQALKRPRSHSNTSALSTRSAHVETKMHKAESPTSSLEHETNKDGRIKITQRTLVGRVVDVSPAAIRYEQDVAYVVDFSNTTLPIIKGKVMTPDGYIRKNNADSWTGSTGAKSGNTPVFGTLFGSLDGPVECRRVHVNCKGVKVCEYFDESLWEKYQEAKRWENEGEEDMAQQAKVIQQSNLNEANSTLAITLRFYRGIIEKRCLKKTCTGVPVLRKLRTPSRYGHNYFVGCSGWVWSEAREHRYIGIPWNVNEDELKAMLNAEAIPEEVTATQPSNTLSSGKCTFNVSPKRTIKTCPYSHIVDGRAASSVPVTLRPCGVALIICVPVEWEKYQKVVVYLRDGHNHPTQAPTGPTAEEEDLIDTAIETVEPVGLTTQGVIRAPTTTQLCGGKPLSVVAPAFGNQRRVRAKVKKALDEAYPKGRSWEGVMHEMRVDASKPADERYIHTVITRPDMNLAIISHPPLLKYIHDVPALSCDFSFKRISGKVDELKVGGYSERLERRIIFMSGLSDRATAALFETFFSEFFRLVLELTGTPLKIKALWPEGDSAHLRAILLDADLAQVLGLAESLAQYIPRYVPSSAVENLNLPLNPKPMDIAQRVVKFCVIHSERNIEKLKCLSRSDLDRLKMFPGLKTDEEIASWHEFCSGLAKNHEQVNEWYKHKLNNPFLLEGINQHLSPMDADNFRLTPRDTNLIEGAHAGRNAETGINLSLMDAILSAKKSDRSLAAELDNIGKAAGGLFLNTKAIREKRAVSRKESAMRKNHERADDLAMLSDLEKQIASLNSRIQESQSSTNSLSAELKAARACYTESNKKDSAAAKKIAHLKADIEKENNRRRDLKSERRRLNDEVNDLKEGKLKGAQIGKLVAKSNDTPQIDKNCDTAYDATFEANFNDFDANINDIYDESPDQINTNKPSDASVHNLDTNLHGDAGGLIGNEGLQLLDERNNSLGGIDFNGIDFSGVDFSGMDFSGVDFEGMDFAGMDFDGFDWGGLDFGGVDFTNNLHSVDSNGSGFGEALPAPIGVALNPEDENPVTAPSQVTMAYVLSLGVDEPLPSPSWTTGA